MRAIVGYTGFVGSNLLRFLKFDKLYNSSNFHEASGLHFTELFFCGLPAEKWKANKFPLEDTENITRIKEILLSITVDKFILISTIDIYDIVNGKLEENYIPNFISNHTYGKNRYLFENFVQITYPDYHILRLPALFGMGLKKNIIFDLINNNQIEKIPINSKFQWYDLDWLFGDINRSILNNIRVINLFSEPLETLEIIKLFSYDISIFENVSRIEYDTTSIFGYCKTKEECLENIKSFINWEKIDKTKLRISNIYPKLISQIQFKTIVKLYGIKQIQIAPTTLTSGIWNFNKELSEYNDMNITSFQSIAYGISDNIFKNHINLLEHIKNVIDYASKNNVTTLVFGCPKNRNKDEEDDENIFIDFFRTLGNYCETKNVIICLEPNSTLYTNYLNTVKETGEIVTKINNLNIKLMVDIGHLSYEDFEYISVYSDIIFNVDISLPKMKPYNSIEIFHVNFRELLYSIKYNGSINLEILPDRENELEDLCISLSNFITLFGTL